MTKPQEYREQRIVAHDTHYRVDENTRKGPQAASGILSTGRVVWVRQASERVEQDPAVSAYAEGIGVVALDPQSLSS